MKRLYILTLISITLAIGIYSVKRQRETTIPAGDGLVIPKDWLITNPNPKTPNDEGDVRPADQTFLTFPEWYLVFSPEEMADYYEHTTSTTFPFTTHIDQIWDSYDIVKDQIEGNFAPNPGYHLMIWVIGVSSTIEYGVKNWYEVVVGRLTDTGVPVTEEDKFNAKFARDYVVFINDIPWYDFDFARQLKDLWTNTPIFGSNIVRKLERRYILTSELLVKYGYAKLIGMGTQQVYEEASFNTLVIIDNDSLILVPRYNMFAEGSMKVAKQGSVFKEIAGNNSAILVTILVNSENNQKFANTQEVFTQVISSDPKWKRIALATPVPRLHELLLQLDKDKVRVEHVFDF